MTKIKPYKTATDVVFNGLAYTPEGQMTEMLIASLIVGEYRKDILVIGDRMCRHRSLRNPIFTDPEQFSSMEIRYERAYGGVDIWSDTEIACGYARNHLGKGFVILKAKNVIDNLPLPNIEDPDDILTPERLCPGNLEDWENQPMPQGLGWVAKFWQPRASLAGVMPADRAVEQQLRNIYTSAIPPEQRERYDLTRLPDMNFDFFNGASQGLVLPFLTCDEWIHLLNLSYENEVSFQLPDEKPVIGLDIGKGVMEPSVVLHTVMIRMEERQVDLVWRGAVPYPGPDWLPEMKKMEVSVL